MSYLVSPLSKDQFDQFDQLRNSLNQLQICWIAGYMSALAGVQSDGNQASAITALSDSASNSNGAASSGKSIETLTVLFGSRTGNGAKLAKQFAEKASSKGLKVNLKNLTEYKVRNFAQEKNVLFIVSTHGEGEVPFEAKEFHDYLFGKRAPELKGLKFTVLGLGDSSYFHFCKAGRDFDSRFEELGAQRFTPSVFLDVNFQSQADQWIQEVLESETLSLGSNGNSGQIQNFGSENSGLAVSPAGLESVYTAQSPFKARILEKIQLHGRESDRKTLHLEIDAPGLNYQVGDALGVLPLNSDAIVNEFLKHSGLSAKAQVSFNGSEQSLSEVLKKNFELSKLTVDVLKKYNDYSKQDKLTAVLLNPDVLKSFIEGRDLVDLFRDYAVKIGAQELLGILRPLQPRLYSISSSPKANPDEVHLTVGVVDFQSRGNTKKGACSNYLNDIDPDTDELEVFIESNDNFRLPSNPETNIIMIGGGTGIAPFRAFVQEREINGDQGKNWLFFGNRNFESEFLYQTEWQQALRDGSLHKLDLAFSRDGNEKVYVQHRMLQKADEIFDWIENGAHVYVCGDRKKMAGDVQNTLLEIIRTKGNKTEDEALDFLNQLIREKRYQTDVY